jgi:hypothetical protein
MVLVIEISGVVDSVKDAMRVTGVVEDVDSEEDALREGMTNEDVISEEDT